MYGLNPESLESHQLPHWRLWWPPRVKNDWICAFVASSIMSDFWIQTLFISRSRMCKERALPCFLSRFERNGRDSGSLISPSRTCDRYIKSQSGDCSSPCSSPIRLRRLQHDLTEGEPEKLRAKAQFLSSMITLGEFTYKAPVSSFYLLFFISSHLINRRKYRGICSQMWSISWRSTPLPLFELISNSKPSSTLSVSFKMQSMPTILCMLIALATASPLLSARVTISTECREACTAYCNGSADYPGFEFLFISVGDPCKAFSLSTVLVQRLWLQ